MKIFRKQIGDLKLLYTSGGITKLEGFIKCVKDAEKFYYDENMNFYSPIFPTEYLMDSKKSPTEQKIYFEPEFLHKQSVSTQTKSLSISKTFRNQNCRNQFENNNYNNYSLYKSWRKDKSPEFSIFDSEKNYNLNNLFKCNKKSKNHSRKKPQLFIQFQAKNDSNETYTSDEMNKMKNLYFNESIPDFKTKLKNRTDYAWKNMIRKDGKSEYCSSNIFDILNNNNFITQSHYSDFPYQLEKEKPINDSLYDNGLEFKPILSECEFSPWFL